MKRYAREAEVENWAELTPHKLRHSFAIAFARAAEHPEDIVILQRILRHARLETTMIYLQYAGKYARDQYEQLPKPWLNRKNPTP